MKQPNGLYCEYSTIVDGFIIYDATEQELEDSWVKESAVKARENFKRSIEIIKKGERRGPFCLTYKEALANHTRIHGELS